MMDVEWACDDVMLIIHETYDPEFGKFFFFFLDYLSMFSHEWKESMMSPYL